MKILSPAIVFLLLFAPFSDAKNLTCTRVVDGDTIILSKKIMKEIVSSPKKSLRGYLSVYLAL
jgi:hypothetical protein